MKTLQPFAILSTMLFMVACSTKPTIQLSPTGYTHLRVTNHRGDTEADWIARGRIRRVDEGFAIKAVAWQGSGPYRSESRYPEGWKTIVSGPHITYWNCDEPLWLFQLENK